MKANEKTETSTYMYILVFKGGTHFKIGFSSTDYSRVAAIEKAYEGDLGKIDFAKSSMITAAQDSTIRYIETHFKRIYARYFPFTGHQRDGSSEIMPMTECYESVMNHLQHHIGLPWLGMKAKPLPQRGFPVKQIALQPRHKDKPANAIWRNYNLMDFLKHPYGQGVLNCIQTGYPITTLYENEMPLVFEFVQGLSEAYYAYSVRGELKGGSILKSPSRFFWSPNGERSHVTIGFDTELIERTLADLIGYVPREIDLNSLPEVVRPTTEEVEDQERFDLAWSKELQRQADECFTK